MDWEKRHDDGFLNLAECGMFKMFGNVFIFLSIVSRQICVSKSSIVKKKVLLKDI